MFKNNSVDIDGNKNVSIINSEGAIVFSINIDSPKPLMKSLEKFDLTLNKLLELIEGLKNSAPTMITLQNLKLY